MSDHEKIRPGQVIGPLGESLTMDSLPSPDTDHSVPRRKAEVVAAVNGGLLSIDEACDRYNFSIDELTSWQRSIERSGLKGLRVTRIQHYRSLYAQQDTRL
jgi:hypothetical protein